MIYPANFEEKTGFEYIKQKLKDLCLGPLGQDAVDEMQFITSHGLLKIILERVNEFKAICSDEDNFPLEPYEDLRDALKKIKIEGIHMDVHEIFFLGKILEFIKAMLHFFKKNNEQYPALYDMCKEVPMYPFILERIHGILTQNGKVKDNASPGLKEVRNNMASKQTEVSRKMQQVFKKAQSSGLLSDDATITLRDGRPVIPISASNKRMIKGYIHDESATGKTVFIEPAEVMELNNEIRELVYAERREIIKILIAFTNDIRPYQNEIMYAFDFLKEVDFLRAKALYAIKVPSIAPTIRTEPYIDWKDAVHPVLFQNHKKEGKTIVPLNITLEKGNRILIISGPNAGGKSVCLKTVGLVQYMVQCGMLAPMGPSSEMGMFDQVFIDIGDEQSIENDLSTYSSHLLNMKHFIKNTTGNTLLLIDEFGTGTEPHIGGAIAESILHHFNMKQAFGVITTHYSNLKHFAASADGIVNGAMLYDTQKMKPLFQLNIGGPGSSFAFEIARNIGIPEEILQMASEKTGGGHVEFDKHLREILREKRYWEKKRANIRKIEKQLEQKLEKYAAELENIDQLKKDILAKSKKESEQIIMDLNRKIEQTIRDIRESNADKTKTQEARKQLENFTDQVSSHFDNSGDLINKKLNKLPANARKKVPQEVQVQQIEIGSKVKMIGQEQVGQVMDINKKSIMVAFGQMVTTLNENQLELISEKEFKKNQGPKNRSGGYSSEVFDKKMNFKPDIDLRGKRAEEALMELNTFLDDALMVNAKSLRILHGKGNGVLKEVIRDYLRTQDFVRSAKDEHIERGGSGITLVELYD
jgi:DNA mismatch repair protein MutS2